MGTKIILTMDADWASEEVIYECVQPVIHYKIPLTFFVTNKIDLIDDLKKYDFIELGIHPNFLPNSTQGKNIDEILSYCLDIVPEAESIRTHYLYQYSYLLYRFIDFGLKYDSSLLLNFQLSLEPFYITHNGQKLIRLGSNFTDFQYLKDIKNGVERNVDNLLKCSLSVFNFHPVHIYYNTYDVDFYNANKNNLKKNNEYKGIKNIFEYVISFIVENSNKVTPYNLKTFLKNWEKWDKNG